MTMYEPTCLSLFTEIIKHIKNGEGKALADNPADAFYKKSVQGFFSPLSDFEFGECLSDVEDLNVNIWDRTKALTWDELFANALRYIELDDEHTFQVARLLTRQAQTSGKLADPVNGRYHYNPVTGVFPVSLADALNPNPKTPFRLKEQGSV